LPEAEPPWPPWRLIVFRFGVCFFTITTLYLAIGHLASLLPFFRSLAETIQFRGLFAAYRWGTEQLFGAGVVYATGAGFIAYLSTALLGAAAATVVWSLIDRRRTSYQRGEAWLRLYLRYLLAAVALSYGAIKVIPSQFAPPSLVALLTPLGEFTRMRLLWHSMGTSMAYTVFTGLVEVGGALLLLSRRTTPLGALVLAAAFFNVTVLNFGYEVGVQLNTAIYTLMALTLLAPDARRLWRAVVDSDRLPTALHPGTQGVGKYVKPLVVVLLLAVNVRAGYLGRREVSARPVLYGIYEVVEFRQDGVSVPPGDETRWLRLVVAERGTGAIQRTVGGRVDQYAVKEDSSNGMLTLTARGSEARIFTLRYRREGDSLLEIGGRVEGHQVEARLRAMDLTTFALRRPRR
jgi:hypothetical protein